MKKYIFIGVSALFVLFVLFLFFVLFRKDYTSQQPLVKPTTIPEPQITFPEVNNADPLELYDLIQLLPIATPDYSIEYLSVSQRFIITVKSSPVAQRKQEALQWFLEQGINPQNLNIQYNVYPYLQ